MLLFCCCCLFNLPFQSQTGGWNMHLLESSYHLGRDVWLKASWPKAYWSSLLCGPHCVCCGQVCFSVTLKISNYFTQTPTLEIRYNSLSNIALNRRTESTFMMPHNALWNKRVAGWSFEFHLSTSSYFQLEPKSATTSFAWAPALLCEKKEVGPDWGWVWTQRDDRSTAGWRSSLSKHGRGGGGGVEDVKQTV